MEKILKSKAKNMDYGAAIMFNEGFMRNFCTITNTVLSIHQYKQPKIVLVLLIQATFILHEIIN